MAKAWFYMNEGQRLGPVSSNEFRRLAEGGQIRPDTLVWCKGLSNWYPAKLVKGLFSQDFQEIKVPVNSSNLPAPIQNKASQNIKLGQKAIGPDHENKAPSLLDYLKFQPLVLLTNLYKNYRANSNSLIDKMSVKIGQFKLSGLWIVFISFLSIFIIGAFVFSSKNSSSGEVAKSDISSEPKKGESNIVGAAKPKEPAVEFMKKYLNDYQDSYKRGLREAEVYILFYNNAKESKGELERKETMKVHLVTIRNVYRKYKRELDERWEIYNSRSGEDQKSCEFSVTVFHARLEGYVDACEKAGVPYK